MSSAYTMEPPTEGKVILHTTRGPFDIELWSKEAPKAVRNFVQLCLEGYYDGTPFHRVIKGFMIQGGDPTGTGTGGESIYGEEFMDEFHQRLRFSHRGILGMASNGPNTNGSQFFITLDACSWLDRKHTIFGKISGESIFNVANLAENTEVDGDDRPTGIIPSIIRTEVLWNPFEDIVPRVQKAKEEVMVDLRPKKKKKKNLSLLSFGEEQNEEDTELDAINKKSKNKSKSAHDHVESLEDTVAEEVQAAVTKAATTSTVDEQKADLKAAVRAATARMKDTAEAEAGGGQPAAVEGEGEAGDGEDDFGSRLKRQMQARAARLAGAKQKGQKSEKQLDQMSAQRMEEMIDFAASESESEDEEEAARKKRKQPEEPDYQSVGKLTLKKVRKLKEGVEDDGFKIAGESSGADRREKRNIKKLQAHKEKDTLAKLADFSATITAKKRGGEVPKEKRKEAEVPKSWQPQGGSMADRLAAIDDDDDEDDEEDDADWASHSLVFEKSAEDKRNERAALESLETRGLEKRSDDRSLHERRLRPHQGKGGGKGGKGKGVNSERW